MDPDILNVVLYDLDLDDVLKLPRLSKAWQKCMQATKLYSVIARLLRAQRRQKRSLAMHVAMENDLTVVKYLAGRPGATYRHIIFVGHSSLVRFHWSNVHFMALYMAQKPSLHTVKPPLSPTARHSEST